MTQVTRRSTLALLGTAAFAPVASPARGTPRGDADLIVIGAGLAGLHAAHLASRAGLKTIVLEAASRAGGRVLTLDDVPGAPNAGASQVGAGYTRLRQRASELGVGLAPDTGEARDTALCVNGQVMRSSDWAKSATNPFPDTMKQVTPGSLLFRLAAAANPLKTTDDWRGTIGRSADIPASEFLKSQGINDEGLRLVDIGLNANALSSYAMLNVWRTLLLFRQDAALGPAGSISGGAQRLTDAMARATGDLRLESAVTAIEATRTGVTIHLSGGRSLKAPFALCTLPFSVLRKLAITGAPLVQRPAIEAMPYTQIVHVYFEPASRFWDSDGLPPDTWTDGPLERLFAVRDRETGLPNGLMLAWLNGNGAAWIRGQSDAGIASIIERELPKVRPSARGRVRIVRTVRWNDENSLAGGAYMHFAPGQVAAWSDTLAVPAGTLHFAGEHLSRVATGMEGALESAETSIAAILKQAGPDRR